MLAAGDGPSAVSRKLGIPVGSVLNWQRGCIPKRVLAWEAGIRFCPACRAEEHQFDRLPPFSYAYLLASYLGDGCLFLHSPRTWKLRITHDTAYSGSIQETAAAVQVLRGRYPDVADDYAGANCADVVSYWNQWGCLFPQHGPGRRHKRKIELTDWQWELVEAAPGQFLRGLIHTDGRRGTDNVRAKGEDYAYPRYQSSNRSDDIRKLFTDVCDMLEIAWRPWGRWHISVTRKDAVETLDKHVGFKC